MSNPLDRFGLCIKTVLSVRAYKEICGSFMLFVIPHHNDAQMSMARGVPHNKKDSITFATSRLTNGVHKDGNHFCITCQSQFIGKTCSIFFWSLLKQMIWELWNILCYTSSATWANEATFWWFSFITSWHISNWLRNLKKKTIYTTRFHN